MLRYLATALRRCTSGDVGQAEQRDLLAYMALVLLDIEQSVVQAAAAWEKRGYWIKADQFRRQWEWVARGREGLDKALSAGDLASAVDAVARLAASVAGTGVKASPSKTALWHGAWEHWRNGHDPGSEPRRERM